MVAIRRESFEEARRHLDRALRVDDASVPAAFYQGFAYHHLGETRRAVESFERIVRDNPEHSLRPFAQLELSLLRGRIGERERSAEDLEAAERAFKANPELMRNLIGLAGVAVLRGDREQAWAWLDKAVESGMRSSMQLEMDPVLSPLRADPRFEALLQRISTGAR